METVQIQLPPNIAQRIRQEIHDNQSLNHVVVEAINLWLRQRRAKKLEVEKGLQSLREAGLVMTSEKQRALTEAMMASISSNQNPSREEVENSLSNLKVSLSAEIDTMRGER